MKAWMRLLFATLLIFGSSGCSKSKISEGVRIAVIPKGTTHDFWKAIHAGAVKAEQDLRLRGIDAKIIWRGPLREDDRDFQIQVVENFASSDSIDGIVLAPLDSTALVAPVELAKRSDVPVVIIDSDINTEDYVSFIATDNYQGGVLAATHLAELLMGKGEVVLLRYQVGSASTENREKGFLDTLQKFPDIEVISSNDYAGATVDAAYQKAETIVSGDIGVRMDGVFCPNETVTIAMTKALKDAGRADGEVKIVGFDSGPQSVIDLQNGDLQALVVQDPMAMGYQGVMHIVAHLDGQKVERRVDTGVFLITRENMQEPEHQRLLYPPIDEYLKSR